MSLPTALAVLLVQPTGLQSFNQVPFSHQHPVNDQKGKAAMFTKEALLTV